MKKRYKWIGLSILGLCAVGLSGLILRTKFVLALPMINYNHLLEGHGHFTFCGWLSLALMTLMVDQLLPPSFSNKSIYQWLLGFITISSWAMLFAFSVEGYSLVGSILFILFILTTYVFSWTFVRDILKSRPNKPVLLFAISSLVCLVLSSAGPLIITYMSFTKSFDAIVYRNALFTYLHLQYNGFFTLAVFALLFNDGRFAMNAKATHKIYRFAILICSSIIPSLFLSYLWQDPGLLVRLVAVAGSLLVLLALFFFLFCTSFIKNIFAREKRVIKFLMILSMCSFVLKMLLQGFTIIPQIGNAIFGNRPIVMGFLHLVFLGFISLFILAFYTAKGFISGSRSFPIAALAIFAFGIIVNEALLIVQGLTAMFGTGSMVFPWLLWCAGVWLFAGTVLVAGAHFITKESKKPDYF
ncbi:MAG: hypothetical protein ACHQET_09175 [Chitinophagales bacterium]